MAKPHPIELRERVVAYVEEGNTHRATAAHFRVSIKFVNDMVKLKRETGSLKPKPRDHRKGKGKLTPHHDWIRARMKEKGDLTLDELAFELRENFDLPVHRSWLGTTLSRIGLSHKKDCLRPRAASRRCKAGAARVEGQTYPFHEQGFGKTGVCSLSTFASKRLPGSGRNINQHQADQTNRMGAGGEAPLRLCATWPFTARQAFVFTNAGRGSHKPSSPACVAMA